MFYAAYLGTNVEVGRVVCLNVCEEGGDLSGCGEVLMAVGVGERVLRCVEVGGWCSEFFTEEDGADLCFVFVGV